MNHLELKHNCIVLEVEGNVCDEMRKSKHVHGAFMNPESTRTYVVVPMPNFKFDGEIRLKNTWAQLITILGSSGLPCNGVVSIPENLVIESGHAVNLKVSSLPGVTRGGVSTGSFTIFVAQRDTLRSSTVRWAASKID